MLYANEMLDAYVGVLARLADVLETDQHNSLLLSMHHASWAQPEDQWLFERGSGSVVRDPSLRKLISDPSVAALPRLDDFGHRYPAETLSYIESDFFQSRQVSRRNCVLPTVLKEHAARAFEDYVSSGRRLPKGATWHQREAFKIARIEELNFDERRFAVVTNLTQRNA